MKGAVSGSCNAGKCTYDSPLAVASCDPGKKKRISDHPFIKSAQFYDPLKVS